MDETIYESSPAWQAYKNDAFRCVSRQVLPIGRPTKILGKVWETPIIGILFRLVGGQIMIETIYESSPDCHMYNPYVFVAFSATFSRFTCIQK